ncbi:MAG: superoxide dismutase [Steroidobacteraceae bacterium]
MNHYVLPQLEYDYGALEPHISGRIIELHYSKHHKAYVDGANKALEQLAEARQKSSLDTAGQIAQTLAFNVSGHVLHSIYWRNMAPKAGGRPSGELAQLLDQHFGGFDLFRQQLTKTAAGIMGSGWAALTWDTLSSQLVITQIHDHQSSTIQGAVPLLVLDAWEHAYYLQYHNEKAKYFEAIWNVWNWNDVAARLAEARHFGLHLKNVADQAA